MRREMTQARAEKIIKKHNDKIVSEAINENTKMLNLLNLDFTDFVTIHRRGRRR